MYLKESKYILEYIKDVIEISLSDPIKVTDAIYHHNEDYEKGVSIIKHGIKTLKALSELKLISYDEEALINLSKSSNYREMEYVFLSKVGLKDLYRDEEEYDTFNIEKLDFLISSEIHAFRASINYGNEFLHHGDILPKYIKSVDIRILEYLSLFDESTDPIVISSLISKFNSLIDLAVSLREYDIFLREASFNEFNELNIKTLSNQPKINL